MPFIAIDFEASCLPQYGRSFPIEVGVASPLGWSQSWLIRPHATWSGWQWSERAEELHGISLDRLEREGLEAWHVVELLRTAIGGSEVIADSPFDDYWSRTLFEAAGQAHIPVSSISDWPELQAIDSTRLEAAVAVADATSPRRHRAEDDARWLAQLMTELQLDCSADRAPAQAISRRAGALVAAR